ncbi:MAG: OmpA family protein [Bacteroidaceae bacterium]|nr:OmpA family protein [Bacteroidaceae bacterium]
MKKVYIFMMVMLISGSAFGQGYQVVDSLSSRTKLDQDSLYYDDWAYLDDYHFWDNIFISGQIGVSHSMSENTRFGNFFGNERLSFNIGVGKWFYPSFGMRITAGLHPQVGRAEWSISEAYPETFGNYTYNMFSGYVDGLVNLTNVVLKYKEDRMFNLVALFGFGYNHTFGFDKEKCAIMSAGLDANHKPRYNNPEAGERIMGYDVDTRPGNYFAAHVGLQGRWKVSAAWDIVGEVTFNGTDDKYNGHEYDRVYDTYFDVLVGAQFHFKDCHGRRRFHYVKNLNAAVIERLERMRSDENERLAEANMAVPEIFEKLKFNEALQTTVSFYVDRYYITDAQKKNVKSVATFLATHPDINLVVTGYADIETAYPAYNLRLSQKRAQAVYDMLVNEFHVPTNRLRIDYKGDTVQPYTSVNEWNRAVIFFLDRNGGKSQVLESETPNE